MSPSLLLDTPVISAGDTAWVLTASALVMVMTVGLAFFYGGLVRPKNSLNAMMMSVVALGVISVQWVLVGYSIAFGHFLTIHASEKSLPQRGDCWRWINR